MDEPEIQVKKMTAWMPASAWLFDPELGDRVRGVLDGTITVPPPLPDPGPHPRWEALLAAAGLYPVLVELVELHKPHADCYPASIGWHCEGEPASGYEWDYADWPCETTAIIAGHLGVDLADDPDHH